MKDSVSVNYPRGASPAQTDRYGSHRGLGVLRRHRLAVAACLGTLALAWAVREATNGSWGSRLGSALMGLYGVGIILTGIFPTDEIDPAGRVGSPTIAGTAHEVVSLLAFMLGLAGVFVLSRTFKRDARWRAFWPWSLALAFAVLVGFIVLALSAGTAWIGLIQRIFNGTIILWLVLVAFRIRSILQRCIDRAPLAGALGV